MTTAGVIGIAIAGNVGVTLQNVNPGIKPKVPLLSFGARRNPN